MENVRDALRYCVNGDLHAAALAEVEEWEDAIDGWIERAEAAEAALAEITSAYEASVVDQTRLEAAEAEADSSSSATTNSLRTSPSRPSFA
jgi:hypothetical protein